MPKLRVHNLSMSVDGYVAGPHQSKEHPLGIGAERLHEWIFATRTGRAMFGDPAAGQEDGSTGVDDRFAAQGNQDIGATIMGRNMFGPVRGGWTSSTDWDEGGLDNNDWNGWWGSNPPFHHQVFVLTHHSRPSVPMEGGTTFHFVTDGIEAALERAMDAANGQDVRLGGGAATVQQYLRAGLVDELHVALVPVLLGAGERLFEDLQAGPGGYECVEFAASEAVAHVRFAKTPA